MIHQQTKTTDKILRMRWMLKTIIHRTKTLTMKNKDQVLIRTQSQINKTTKISSLLNKVTTNLKNIPKIKIISMKNRITPTILHKQTKVLNLHHKIMTINQLPTKVLQINPLLMKIKATIRTHSTLMGYLTWAKKKKKLFTPPSPLNKFDLTPISSQYIKRCSQKYPLFSPNLGSIGLKKVSLGMELSHTESSMDRVNLRTLTVWTSFSTRTKSKLFICTSNNLRRKLKIHSLPWSPKGHLLTVISEKFVKINRKNHVKWAKDMQGQLILVWAVKNYKKCS